MNNRLHEIIAHVAVIHNSLIETNEIKDVKKVFAFLENYDIDIKEHYINLLLQYYFQKNDLKNLKELLLVGAKFDMRFDDVCESFLNIKSEDENVIDFMQDNVVFVKQNVDEKYLLAMYEYYINNKNLQSFLEYSIEIIKKNRYVCSYCYGKKTQEYARFFLNEDLLESLKKDLPYLLK